MVEPEAAKDLQYVSPPFKEVSLFHKDFSSTYYVPDTVLGAAEDYKWLCYCLRNQETLISRGSERIISL